MHLELTSEGAVGNRRHFLRELVRAGLLAGPAWAGCSAQEKSPPGYPAPRSSAFDPGWRLTHAGKAARYNNFYEFSTSKTRVAGLAAKLPLTPWPVEVTGLVERPLRLDAAELIELFALEERVYRLRCVEAWAMVVPWTGFPLAALLSKVVPRAQARFVRFEGIATPAVAPGWQAFPGYPWPYTEALRLEEALHPLALMACGIYGRPLPTQHGAPLRLVVPWKYGFKSIKSITRIELTATRPTTFWSSLVPAEYTFEANVDPAVPHPRWSQATEVMIDTGERIRTQPFNGYGDEVARLYGSA